MIPSSDRSRRISSQDSSRLAGLEPAERLVEDQQLGPGDDRPRQRTRRAWGAES